MLKVFILMQQIMVNGKNAEEFKTKLQQTK